MKLLPYMDSGLHRFWLPPGVPKDQSLGPWSMEGDLSLFSPSQGPSGAQPLTEKGAGVGLGCGTGTSLERERPSHFVKNSLVGPPALQTNSWGVCLLRPLQCNCGWAPVLPPPPQAAEVGGGNSGKGCGWLVTTELDSRLSPVPRCCQGVGGRCLFRAVSPL